MKSRRTALVTIAVLSFTASPAFSQASEAVALEFVRQQRVGANLPGMALSTVQRTTTFGTLASRLGQAAATSKVSSQINRLLPKYQDHWDRNLALSYAAHFSDEELKSLAQEGKASKFAPKLAAKQPEVGAAMRARSESVLTGFVTEVLSNAARE